MTYKIKTFAYSPMLWLLVSFAFIAIATTRCGDAYR
jgi:hypothetical protein